MEENKITALDEENPTTDEQEAAVATTATDEQEPVVDEGVSGGKSVKEKETLWQAIKYACCTASAGVIEFGSMFLLLHILPIDPEKPINFITTMPLINFVGTLISLSLSIIWNFTLNRKFTFKSANNVPKAMALAFLFYVPFFPFKLWFNGYVPQLLVAGAAAEAGMEVFAYLEMHKFATMAVEAMTMLLNGVLEFLWQKFVIYRNSANTNDLAKKTQA